MSELHHESPDRVWIAPDGNQYRVGLRPPPWWPGGPGRRRILIFEGLVYSMRPTVCFVADEFDLATATDDALATLLASARCSDE